MLINKLKKPSASDSLDPILAINDFEEETESILDLAKDEASKIIQEAKAQAGQIIQEAKGSLSAIETEYLARLKKESKTEEEKLIEGAKLDLQCIVNIPQEKIRQAAEYVLEKVIPK